MTVQLSATHFVDRLKALQSEDELEKVQRYFKTGKGRYGEGDTLIGVRTGER